MGKAIRYKDAGVDIAAGEEAVERIKKMVRSTFNPQVLTDLGKFGGFFAPDLRSYQQPVLVSSIDGVGTKLKVAFVMEKHDTVGEDLVYHCVNDIFVGGAKPLFFLDYVATGTLRPGVVEEIVSGMVRACSQVGCALIGGEMAEMPGFYQGGEFDVAGCIVGIVEKKKIIDGHTIQKGDVLIGLPSSGLHTNGYSLARKVLFEKAGFRVDTAVPELGMTVGEALLKVHRCYFPLVYPLLDKIKIKGMSHITGGGIEGNTQRVLPGGLRLQIQWGNWHVPPIFKLIQHWGSVPDDEMRRIFNLGIGLILIVGKENRDQLIALMKKRGEDPVIVGHVI